MIYGLLERNKMEPSALLIDFEDNNTGELGLIPSFNIYNPTQKRKKLKENQMSCGHVGNHKSLNKSFELNRG